MKNALRLFLFTLFLFSLVAFGFFTPNKVAFGQQCAGTAPPNSVCRCVTVGELSPTPRCDWVTQEQAQRLDQGMWPIFLEWALTPIINIILEFFGVAVYLAGIALNGAIEVTIIGMKTFVDQLTAINDGWKTARDLSNIFFIFIIIYIGIRTILGIASGEIKKQLARIIVVALLINFSLFFTKVAIDASNFVTIKFYEQIAPGATWDRGIANTFIDALKIASIYDVENRQINPQVQERLKLSGTSIVLIGLFGSIFLLVTAFVLFAIAILLVIRFVILILLMVTSPFAFIGLVLPGAQGISNTWKDSFIKQLLFAPVLMMLLWFAATLANSPSFRTLAFSPQDQRTFTDFFTGVAADAAKVAISFFILIGAIVASIIAAQRIGATGAGAFSKWGQGVARSFRGGLQGVVGRNTVGRLSRRLGRGYDNLSGRLQEASKESRFARYAYGTLKGTGIERGTKNLLTKGETAKFGSGLSLKEDTEAQKARTAQLNVVNARRSLDQESKTMESSTPGSIEYIEAEQKLTKTLSGLSEKQLEDISPATLKNKTVMKALPPRLYLSTLKSDKFSDDDKKEFKSIREEPLREALERIHLANSTPGAMPAAQDIETVRSLTDQERKELSQDIFTNPRLGSAFADTARQSQIDDLMKAENIAPSIRKIIRDNQSSVIQMLISNGRLGEARDKITRMSPDRIVKLPSSILTHANIAPVLPQPALRKILDEQSLNLAERTQIRTHIGVAAASGEPVATKTNDWLTHDVLGRNF